MTRECSFACARNTKSCNDAEYTVATDAAKRKIYKCKKAFHLLVICSTGIVLVLNNQEKTKTLNNGEAFQVCKNLFSSYVPSKVVNLLQMYDCNINE